LEREYGIAGSIKLASNENPFGPSPLAVEAMQSVLTKVHRYPDGSGYYLTRALADHCGVSPDQVVLGNGSNEIIEFLVKAFIQTGDEAISSHPSFLMYQKFVQVRGGKNHIIGLSGMQHDLERILATISDRTRLIFLDNPNNPTGTAILPDDLEYFLARVPERVVVALDEAYLDFMDAALKPDTRALISERPGDCGVVCLRTFSKAYGLAGVRIGFGLMDPRISSCLHKVRQPFNINQVALTGAEAALKDVGFYRKTITETTRGKRYLVDQLAGLGLTTYPSQTNFFLIDIKGDATKLYQAMLKKGVIVRSMAAYGFPEFIRINIGTAAENERFLESLAACLKECGYG
jgi:histidinol-phosphate aminotransferase